MKFVKIIVGVAGIGAAFYVGCNASKVTYEVLDGVLDKLGYEEDDSLGCEVGKAAIGAAVGGAIANGIMNFVSAIIS